MIKPKNLNAGSRIAILSPAGSVQPNVNYLDHVISYIKKHGYTPVLGKHALDLYENHYAYGGTIENRIKDLNWALNDTNIDAVWATKGGYGCGQLLDDVELKEFAKSPKWYIGFSDNTFIHALLNKNGFQSLHAHNVVRTGGAQEEDYESIFSILKGEKLNYITQGFKEFNKNGISKGKLIGGNLTCLCSLIGTRFNFHYDDSILFIEETNENEHYKIDRYLTTLEQSGQFNKIKGLLIGSMRTNIDDERIDFNHSQMSIIRQKLEKYSIPLGFGFQAGHIATNTPLIFGAKLTLAVHDSSIAISEND